MPAALPKFYYASGTSWLFNFAGVTVDPTNAAVYSIFNTPPTQVTRYIEGLDGATVPWTSNTAQTGFGDCFPEMLDETLWNPVRIVYPASTIGMEISMQIGVKFVVDDVLRSPVGTKFAVGGYSQGAAVAHRVIMETRPGGRLAARAKDLVAAVTYGAPTREANHTFPGSSGYSGCVDIPGSTQGGHGTFPANLRMQNTPDWCWDFTMPNEVISGIGDSADGKFIQSTVGDTLTPVLQIGSLLAGVVTSLVNKVFKWGKGRGFFDWMELVGALGVAPDDPNVNRALDGALVVTDALTGEQGLQYGGGHAMYPYFPPPNANGSIPATGDTCYQIAARYLNSVGARLKGMTPFGEPKVNPSVIGNDGFTAPICIYTFDGTNTAGPNVISDPSINPSGSYPQELGYRLAKDDPTVWSWYPVNYQPNRALPPANRPISKNVEDAADEVVAHILANPGKKIVLSGLSQGSVAAGFLYNEFRNGVLQSRRSDLIGVVNFGDALRPRGWTTPLYGAIDPGGKGCVGNLPLVQSYGLGPGLIQSPEPLYWALTNLGDAASAVTDSAAALVEQASGAVTYANENSPDAIVYYYNEFGVPNGPISTYATLAASILTGLGVQNAVAAETYAGPAVFDLVLGFMADPQSGTAYGASLKAALLDNINFWSGSLAVFTPIAKLAVGALPAISQWLPFLVKGAPPYLGTPVPQITTATVNPHGKYSAPFAYTGLANNTKTAVQLAYDHLISLGKRHAPTALAPVNLTNNKLCQLYTFGKTGNIFDSSAASVGASWPSLTTLGSSKLTADFGKTKKDTSQTGPQATLAGLLNATKVEWVPVSYSAAAFPLRNAIDSAVDRTVAMILASPSNTKFALSGHGVGAIVATRVRDEFRTGNRLAARSANLVGVFNFGNPLRPADSWVGDNPGGQGGARVPRSGAAPSTTPADDKGLVWEFAAPGDVVAVQPTGATGESVREAIAVLTQNVPDPAQALTTLTAQARYNGAAVSTPILKDVVLALFSNAAVAHNSYTTFNPTKTVARTAVQVAADAITKLIDPIPVPLIMAPVTDRISVPQGKAGLSVVVSGINFVPGSTTVTIGGVSAPVTATTATTVTVTVPTIATEGAKNVVVTTPGGTVTAPNIFTYHTSHAPALTTYTSSGTGTYTIPAWANRVDVVTLGGGQAGFNGINSKGGKGGTFGKTTLIRGRNLPWSVATIAYQVGAGGASNGAEGVVSSAAYCIAGPGGKGGSTSPIGLSAGSAAWNGSTYSGGGQQGTKGGTGNLPGGGGGAGNGSTINGGRGGVGAVWFRAYQ